MTARGHDVHVLTGLPNYPYGKVYSSYYDSPEKFQVFQTAKIFRVPIIARGQSSIRLILNYISFVISAITIGLFKIRKNKYDVIFVFEPSPITVAIPAIFLGSRRRIPVVMWVLDLWPESLRAVGVLRSPAILAIIGVGVNYIYRHCDLILGQSRGFVSEISKRCRDRAKIRYFPNWGDKAEPLHTAFRSTSLSITSEKKFNVFFAGNIGEAQDVPAIVQAIEYLRECDEVAWVIVGDGRLLPWMRESVNARGLAHKVTFTGQVQPGELKVLFSDADALLVSLRADPIFSETIPGKIQSYLTSGLPIVGMIDGEGASVITSAKAGLVCPSGDGRALADVIRHLCRLPAQELSKFGMNGMRYADVEFNRDKLMDQLENLLFEAITRMSPR